MRAQRAQNKEDAVAWAVNKMMDLAAEGDADGVERVNAWGYDRARGSNARKETLQHGYEAARTKLRVTAEEAEG